LRAEKQRSGEKTKTAAEGDDDNDIEEERKKAGKKEKKTHKVKKEKQSKKDSKSKTTPEDDEDSTAESDTEVKELRYDSEETQEVITTLSEFVVSKGDDPSVADFFEELRMQQIAKVFDNKVRFYVAIQALFGKTIPAKEITGKKKYLTKIIQNGNMSPEDILWGFEVYLVNNPATKKMYPVTLKGLYDAEIVTEEQFLKHYMGNLSTPGFATAKKAAKPFLDWLQEASEDSDSDSDKD